MAISCAGGNEGISIDGAVTATKNQVALSGMLWVRARVITVSDIKLIDYTVFNSLNSRFTLQWVVATPGLVRVGGRATDAEGQKFTDGTFTLVPGPWTHLIGCIDYTASQGLIYVNGVLNTSVSLVNAPFSAPQTANTNSENSSGSGGSIAVRSNATQGFEGDIEDMRLYNRIIGPSEAMTIYSALGEDGIQAGLLHRFPMNERAPGTVLGAITTDIAVNVAEFERIDGSSMGGSPVYVNGIIRSSRMRWGRSRSKGR